MAHPRQPEVPSAWMRGVSGNGVSASRVLGQSPSNKLWSYWTVSMPHS
jgi:hypothetical protein